MIATTILPRAGLKQLQMSGSKISIRVFGSKNRNELKIMERDFTIV